MRSWIRAALKKVGPEYGLGPILIAAMLAVLVAVILCLLVPWYGEPPREIFKGMYIEAFGAVMDIFVFGVVIALMVLRTNHGREHAQSIVRQSELIDDFKKWNADEARHRIAGAVRRLNRLGCTEIDFSGLELSEFSFAWHEIKSIEGSTFYDGSWGKMSRRDRVILEKVDFLKVNCRNVVFSKFNPLSGLRIPLPFATFKDCTFRETQLQGAVFRGANLEWSEEPPQFQYELLELDDGSEVPVQNYWPPFNEADLTDASFENATFKNADFRGALSIQNCSFVGAKGLETCLFDDENVRKSVLKAARQGGD